MRVMQAYQQTPECDLVSFAEVVTRDSATTFKVRVNLVQVRVVVRDENGKVVENLKKEDFQLFDNRKPQTISTFSMETPASRSDARRAFASAGCDTIAVSVSSRQTSVGASPPSAIAVSMRSSNRASARSPHSYSMRSNARRARSDLANPLPVMVIADALKQMVDALA